MTQLRFIPAVFSASAVFLLSSLSSALQAPEPGCGNGPACQVGFECNVVGASSCPGAAACAPGSACPDPEPCTNVEVYGCTPAHCTGDSECGPGMVCHTWTESCPVTDCACAPDTPDCGCGTGTAVCDPQSVSMCTPRYVLPCKLDADCGMGFTCEEQMSDCASSGSGGAEKPAPAPGADAAPVPPGAGGAPPSDPIEPIPVPNCNPQPSGVFQCVAKPIACAVASDCPAGWLCEQVYVSTATCAPGAECEPAADPIPATSMCRPEYYGVDSSGGLNNPTTGGGTGETGGGTTTGTPSPNPQQPTTPNKAGNDGDASSHESAACQMGHAPASSGALSLLVMLGALFGLKRRRAQG